MTQLSKKLSGSLLLLGALFGFGISVSAGVLDDWPVGETLYFEGPHIFFAQAIAEDRVLFEGALTDHVWITRVDRHTISAYVEEYFGDGSFNRILEFDGTISDGGVVTLTNESGLSDMMQHIGIIPHGPGVAHGYVTWKGKYDGTNLVAQMRGIGLQFQSATFPPYMKDPSNPELLFTGPIEIVLTLDLVLVE